MGRKRTGKIITCSVCGTQKYKKGSQLCSQNFCSRSCSSKVTKNGFKLGHLSFLSKESISKIGESLKGRSTREDTRLLLKAKAEKQWSEFRTKMLLSLASCKRNPVKGERHHSWKGGITPVNTKIRKSLQYKKWRLSIFERDNFTCKLCGERGGILNADHIKPFSVFPELRLSLDNGRTLCKKCHESTDTYGFRIFAKMEA
jgi:hypothetical protein